MASRVESVPENMSEEDHEESDPSRGSGTDSLRVQKEISRGSEKGPTPGLLYLSRIPPFMKPRKVRHIFSQFGDVGRIYLQPEDPMVRRRRKKFGGNKKQNYTEGWVEFADKKIAKAVALALNNTPVGGKKRSHYHDDLWNMKYLSKFRWTHLTEKIAYEQAVREQKMRTEISQAKRENTHYLQNVEKGKEIQAIVERKRKRGASEDELAGKAKRCFKQRSVAGESEADSTATQPQRQGAAVKLHDSLLRKILPA